MSDMFEKSMFNSEWDRGGQNDYFRWGRKTVPTQPKTSKAAKEQKRQKKARRIQRRHK